MSGVFLPNSTRASHVFATSRSGFVAARNMRVWYGVFLPRLVSTRKTLVAVQVKCAMAVVTEAYQIVEMLRFFSMMFVNLVMRLQLVRG